MVTDPISVEAEHVLHFDHDPVTRKVTTTGLRLEGFEVADAGSIAEALEFAQVQRFSAAVIDCSRPEEAKNLIDELETKTTSPVPVVLLTSRANRVPFRGADQFPCLVRPFTTPALSLVLYPLLGGSRRSSADIQVLERSKISEDSLTPPPQMVSVGDYQLITEIARGGMGTVYLARRSRDAGVNRLYALKLLHAHLSNDPNFVSMLRDEAALASRINHQNVVAVNDVGSDGDDQHFIVMDYVEGVSLSKLAKRKGGVIREDVIAAIFVDALEGLHGAHTVTDGRGNSLDLVHRDVSPENILIGTDGAARIADFGVAKARIRLTETLGDVRKGKLAYLAPEQLIDDEAVDHRVDIWAAGVSLWGALTGKSLFAQQADSEAKIMRGILDRKIPKPSTEGRNPHPFLDEVVLKALERDPGDRFASARDMSEAIRAAAMKEGLLASGPAVGELVLSVCESEVRDRREVARLSAAVSMNHMAVASSGATLTTRTDETSIDSVSGAEALTDAEGPVTVVAQERESNRRMLPFFLLGALVAGGGLVWAVLPSSPEMESSPSTRAAGPAQESGQARAAVDVDGAEAPRALSDGQPNADGADLIEVIDDESSSDAALKSPKALDAEKDAVDAAAPDDVDPTSSERLKSSRKSRRRTRGRSTPDNPQPAEPTDPPATQPEPEPAKPAPKAAKPEPAAKIEPNPYMQ